MTDHNPPEPIVDAREHKRFSELKEEYEDLRTPGPLGRGASSIKKGLATANGRLKRWIPGLGSAQKSIGELLQQASQKHIIKKALSKAAKGGGLALQWSAQKTLSRPAIVRRLRSGGVKAERFEDICRARGYDIEPIAEKDWKSRSGAAFEGFGTGVVGGARGALLSLALSMTLFYRATQRIALHFGYDALGRDSEQALAADVTLQALQPNDEPPADSTASVVGKVLIAAEVSALTKALKRRTYQEMAEQGASQLLYVRLRATASKAAQKALDKAGQEGFENAIVQRLLRDLGERIPKRIGQRAVPIVGGLIGAGMDSYYMDRVIRGATLFYHKRFIAEKEERVRRWAGPEGKRTDRSAEPPSPEPPSRKGWQQDLVGSLSGEKDGS